MVPSPDDLILELIAQAEQKESRTFLRSCLLWVVGIVAVLALIVWLWFR